MVDRIRTSGFYDLGMWSATIIGQGGIGALTSILLAKMGVFAINGIDHDDVDEENIATQMFGYRHLDWAKVDAVLSQVDEYAPDIIYRPFYVRVDDVWAWGTPIVISAVDSISARKDIWRLLCRNEDWSYYIDARMSLEDIVLYIVRWNDRELYNSILEAHDDDKIVDLPCTSKATFYTAASVAGLIGSVVSKIARGEDVPNIISFSLKTYGSAIV